MHTRSQTRRGRGMSKTYVGRSTSLNLQHPKRRRQQSTRYDEEEFVVDASHEEEDNAKKQRTASEKRSSHLKDVNNLLAGGVDEVVNNNAEEDPTQGMSCSAEISDVYLLILSHKLECPAICCVL